MIIPLTPANAAVGGPLVTLCPTITTFCKVTNYLLKFVIWNSTPEYPLSTIVKLLNIVFPTCYPSKPETLFI